MLACGLVTELSQAAVAKTVIDRAQADTIGCVTADGKQFYSAIWNWIYVGEPLNMMPWRHTRGRRGPPSS